MSKKKAPAFGASVFLNAPFDEAYAPIFQAIVFAVHDCGLTVRCALEIDDGGMVRFEKICGLMKRCRFGIHDISRTELDAASLPRFNMPLELGLFLGARRFGGKKLRTTNCLILDRKQYRYQRFCSDIAGQDIRSHGDNPESAIRRVRDWLGTALQAKGVLVPGGHEIVRRYSEFSSQLPTACTRLRLRPRDLTFGDYLWLVTEWLKTNPW